jgi:Family of unknown function (DUF6325)
VTREIKEAASAMLHTKRRTPISIGPLEYVVLGFEDHQFASEVLPELNAIQVSGLIRAVNLVFVGKETDGTVAVQEVSELSKEEFATDQGLADELAGLLTIEDIEHLTGQIPTGTSAVIVLFTSGMVPPTH